MFNVVLVEPEIPPNTGNVGRLCLATRSTLHLVKPFGFSLEDRQLRRAGLDYWDEVRLEVWESFDALQRVVAALKREAEEEAKQARRAEQHSRRKLQSDQRVGNK